MFYLVNIGDDNNNMCLSTFFNFSNFSTDVDYHVERCFPRKSGIKKITLPKVIFPPTTPQYTYTLGLDKYTVKEEHGGWDMNCEGEHGKFGFIYFPNKDVICMGSSMDNNGHRILDQEW